MIDILNEAATVVEGMEREGILRRVDALLQKYPTGMCMFIISDNDVAETTIVEAATNTDRFGMMCLMNVAADAVIREAEERGE
jgi:hypothetical protein